MLTKKEIPIIILVSIILALVISLVKSLELFLYALLSVFLIIIINVVAKKITAFYLDSEIEVKLWEIKRYGFRASSYFKRPFLAGVFFPIILAAFSFGYFIWMASLVFDVKAKVYRAAKRHSIYNFSEMTEYHIGLIAAAGILANLVFSIVGYLIGLPEQMAFTRLSAFYIFFNMLPISDLDGNKIFFGSIILWSFFAAIALAGLGYVLLIP